MSCCNTIDTYFGAKHADRDLKRYLKNGPDRTTALLIEAVREAGLERATLLDIGAGIGVLQHELFPHDISSAVHVDASPAYIEVAKAECRRRDQEARATFVTGDITEVAGTLEIADIVLLDRVVCCYPNYDDLIRKSISRCRRVYAISYPRDRMLSRVAFWLDNLKRVFRRQVFRVFVHPVADVESLIAAAGFERVSVRQTLIWRVAAFRRV